MPVSLSGGEFTGTSRSFKDNVSMSVTRTVPGRGYGKVDRKQRVYDHLYDPVYTVSSEVDHARSILQAHATKDRVKRVPDFGSMFSALPHYPRLTVQLDPVDPVPASVGRCWRGHTEQRTQALQQLAGVAPNAETRVTGADRWKYFKSPLIPFGQQIPPNVVLSLPKEDFVTTGAVLHLTHTVGVQTDYRESETQTDPYSPDYVVQPGPSELLQLASLTWGRGLPAGLAEVNMILWARAKRNWEASLPPLDDLEQRDKRRRMMKEMQAKEWAFREEEIKKLQEDRLAVLKDLLQQRHEAQIEATNERLNQIYSKLEKEKDTKLHKIHNDYIKSLRKLQTKRRNKEKLERHGKDPQAYVSRIHRNTYRNTPRNHELKSQYLDTHEGLLELEAGLSGSVLKPSVKGPTLKVVKAHADEAIDLIEKYKAQREEEKKQVKPLRFLVKKAKAVPRPPTPSVEEPAEEEEDGELAVIILQKLIRGRSVQYEMFKDKQKHVDLIRELRSVHALRREEQELQKAEQDGAVALKLQRDEQNIKTSRREALQAGLVAVELEQVFDTFSKELIGLQEERRIHAFTLLAERDRRLREAEESGRRQEEEQRRREDDEIFRQVVQVHQDTVDLYLEDIILETSEQAADQQAREEIHTWAKEVDDVAHAMEESRNSLQSEEIVTELVYSFLTPEVHSNSVRQRVHQKQHRHLLAARSIIQAAAEDSGRPSSEPGASQVASGSDSPSSGIPEETISQVEQDAEQHHTD